ncbi:MAG: response regulator transcription factor [Bacteroidota bacterium]
MEKINVLIVEDDEDLSFELKENLEMHDYHIAGIASNHQQALQMMKEASVDLLIIDIFLNGIPEGINLAETISTLPGMSRPFVFLTSSTDRKTFERAKLTEPYSYLLKPYNELELLYAIELALEKFYHQSSGNFDETEDSQEAIISDTYLFIRKGRALKKVLLANIIYIEVEEKHCYIYTEKEKFVVLISLKKMLILLGDKFCRTHRNHIVNIDHIQEIIPVDNLILLSGGYHATLSDKYRDLIKKVNTLK